MENKEKNYYWIIPVVIGVFLLIGGTIVVFIWSVFAGVNGILKNVSKDIQGDWVCDNNIKIRIDDKYINYNTLYSDTVEKYSYRVNNYNVINNSQEYGLIVKSNQGNSNLTITKDKINNNKITLTFDNGKVYNCEK